VAGEPGVNGLGVPKPVVEEGKEDRESATTPPRPSMVHTVMVMNLRSNPVILNHALLMVAGIPGVPGLHVVRVVQELRQGRDSVTIQIRNSMVHSVRVMHLDHNCAPALPALPLPPKTAAKFVLFPTWGI